MRSFSAGRKPAALALVLAFSLLLGATVLAAEDAATTKARANYGQLEMSFEANWGQADPAVRFLARGQGYGVLLTDKEAVVTLRHAAPFERNPEGRRPGKGAAREAQYESVRVRLADSGGAAEVIGEGLLPGKVNYFSGKDPANWRTDIPTYRGVRLSEVYPGVDLVYYGSQRELEFDFVVAPGASANSIQLAYEGVEGLRVEADGELVLTTRFGEIRQHSPKVYQHDEKGALKAIAASHVMVGEKRVGFRVGEYDRARPLVIDPKLSYSTYLGATGEDDVYQIAVDSAGSAYVAGLTTSTNYPVLSAYQSTAGSRTYDNCDGFVTKLNATGTALVYSTYFHGNDGSVGVNAIAVDSAGNAYLGGWNTSFSLPVTSGAFQTTTDDLFYVDGFLTKLGPTGSQLLYSTYITGEDGNEEIWGVAVNAAGEVYGVGYSDSGTSFPTKTGSYQTITQGETDAFALKLAANGKSLGYSTFLGGTSDESAMAVAVDSSGNAYVTGWTDSTDYPTSAGAYKPTGGGRDAFLTKLNATGSALAYSSKFGGSSEDAGYAVAADSQGYAYVTGRTMSSNFPTTAGAFQTALAGTAGTNDAWVLKMNQAGSTPAYSTLLGGAGDDRGWGIAVDGAGNAHVTGLTESTDFPKSADATQASKAGGSDAFVTKVNAAGSGLAFSTYLGGTNTDAGYSIALDASGFAYVTGLTFSTAFPTTTGAYQTTYRGNGETFVTKFEIGTQTAPVLSIVSGNNQTGTVGVALGVPLIVEVRNGGTAVSGATVTFTSTGATLNPASVVTGADGRASTVATPTVAGAITINAATAGATGVVFTATATAAQVPVTFTSAASFLGGALAPGMLASAWGQNFTTGLNVAPANVLPLPTTLGGVTVTVHDSAGTDRVSSLFFTSGTQINFYLDAATQGGPATVRIHCQNGTEQTATVNIESVNPGLFTLNASGAGIVAGNGIRVRNGQQTYFQIYRYDSGQAKFFGEPIDLGYPTDQVFLELYGTGFRNRTGLANVSVTIGGTQVPALYMGAVAGLIGLDQLNVELPRSLAGRGDVNIVVTVDGKTANTVTVNVAAVTPAPALTLVSPNSARAGDTVNLTFTGTNLSGAQIAFNPAAGMTVSNVNATATQVTATLKIDATAATGARTVNATTPYGTSNNLTFTVNAALVPNISSLSPSKSDRGTSFTLGISGTNLTGVTGVQFEPAEGITISNLNVSSQYLVSVSVTIAADATPGERTVTVLSSAGASNSRTFTINAVLDPTFVISNFRAGPAKNNWNSADVPVVVDFVDPQGATVTGRTRINFNLNNGGVTGWTEPATVNGTTSGTISMTISFYGSNFYTGTDYTIAISVERPAGERRSNTVTSTFRVQ